MDDLVVRLPKTAHSARPWRIHEITGDFRLADVWALPTPGDIDDFPRLVRQLAEGAGTHRSPAVRALFALRWKLGKLFGWDRPDFGVGTGVPTLRDRLPADLRDAPPGPALRSIPFTSVYLTHNEWALESANRTVHAVLHVSWVPDEATGVCRGQMAMLVKPNGTLGVAYLTVITPFRRLIVWPSMIRMIGRDWHEADM
ncbi:DUF2867 domain-containing protein [Nocardia huaxiensis]|uniref:DUF2867 domain-containing protein n=1 Tax=Nocardia huaxiensis TaxID=2755382 RepID=UPI001E4C4B1A|nr:DUF2867 domain-containing protein [Nocardia huaxiensis]UFS96991.1 DUF2867 domain-containing protein [Nocardia huaxiensis]